MDSIITTQQTAIQPVRSLAHLVTEWERNLTARVKAQEISQDTADGYKIGAGRFMLWLQQSGETPGPDAIRQWKAELLTTKKPATVNAWLSGVRSFYTWAAEIGEIPFNPTQAIRGAKRSKSKKHSRQPLTDEEVKALLSRPDTATADGCRDAAMLALMLYTAARTVELYHADLEDIHNEGGQMVLYVQGKGHTEKDESLVLHSAAERTMLEWVAHRGQKPGPLFTSLSDRSNGGRLSRRAIRGIVKRYFAAAGIFDPRKTTHSLRHTAVTKALKATKNDIIKVRGMTRHASSDTLLIYAHENDRREDPAEKYIEY